MAIADFFDIIPTIGLFWNTVIFISLAWLLVVIVIVIIIKLSSRKKKGIDVSALSALASSDPVSDETTLNADPKEIMTILQIERVAASTALSAVKDARKSKRINSSVRDSLVNRYKARIAKIDTDLKRRSGAQEYKSLADSLEQSRDRVRGEIAPSTGQVSIPPPPSSTPSIPSTAPPPPPSSTPGIPSTAPPVPGVPKGPPTAGPPSSISPPPIPGIPSTGSPSLGAPPSKPSSPIPTPPRIPPVSSSAKPTTVVPPSVAPPTVSTPPLPPKLPSSSPIAPPTTSNMAPPPVPTSSISAPTTAAAPVAPTGDGDGQSISDLRMEMLVELARLKKFMSEETRE